MLGNMLNDLAEAIRRWTEKKRDPWVLQHLHQVGRTDWTPMGLAELAVLMFSLRRLWYTGGIIHAGTKTVINCTFQMTCQRKHRKKHLATNVAAESAPHPRHVAKACNNNTQTILVLWQRLATCRRG